MTASLRALVVIVIVGLPTSSPSLSVGAPDETSIDINHASIERLIQLPGIGRKRAELIVDARRRRPFRRIRDLLRIRGIGPRMLKKMAPLITVTPMAPAPAPYRFRPRPLPVPRQSKTSCIFYVAGQVFVPR